MSQPLSNSIVVPTDTAHYSQPAKATGTCPVCKSAGIRLTHAGKLYHHGRGGHCMGVGAVPLSGASGIVHPSNISQAHSSVLPTASLSSSSLSPPSTDPLPYTSPRGILPPMIKWIPRAARKHCATLLTKLLMGVVNKPSKVGSGTSYSHSDNSSCTGP